VAAYVDTWTAWFEELPTLVRARAAALGIELPPADQSVLQYGFVICRSWEMLRTQQVFLDSVFRALLYTPAFCMVAIFVFVRNLVLSYMALYCIVGMIITILGVLQLMSVPLGPVEALALSVTIGVSVDYLIHLSFAFLHSLLPDRRYKSRAALFARAGSITAAAITTLFAVVPLLFAGMVTLQRFGIIFTVVTLVAYAFTMLFYNAMLMVFGPISGAAGAYVGDQVYPELVAADSDANANPRPEDRRQVQSTEGSARSSPEGAIEGSAEAPVFEAIS